MKNKLKNIAILSALSVILMYIINKFIFSISILKDILKKDQGDFYDWRFGKIYYTKQGEGSPLLLVHDLNPYSSSYEWNELIAKLAKNHTIYTIDLIGCGRSDKPNMTYTNYLYVQLISDFINNIIHSKTDVAVSGLSGSFVTMACFINSDLFDKIMIINPHSLSSLNKIPSKRTKTMKFLLELPIIGTLLYNIIVSEKFIEDTFIEKVFFNPFLLQKNYVNAYYEAAHLGESNARFLLSSLEGNYINSSITRALKSINNSMFLLGGAEADDIDIILEEYISCNPSIETHIIPKTKVLPQVEQPASVFDQMMIFFL